MDTIIKSGAGECDEHHRFKSNFPGLTYLEKEVKYGKLHDKSY